MGGVEEWACGLRSWGQQQGQHEPFKVAAAAATFKVAAGRALQSRGRRRAVDVILEASKAAACEAAVGSSAEQMRLLLVIRPLCVAGRFGQLLRVQTQTSLLPSWAILPPAAEPQCSFSSSAPDHASYAFCRAFL